MIKSKKINLLTPIFLHLGTEKRRSFEKLFIIAMLSSSPVSPCAFHMFCILDAFREGGWKTKRRVWVSESSKEKHLGWFCLLGNKVCCVLLPWLLQQHRGEAEHSIHQGRERLQGFPLSAGPHWWTVVNQSSREHCRHSWAGGGTMAI